MNVYTYYEPLGLNDAESLIPLWTTAWRNAGFTPIVLTPRDLNPGGYASDYLEEFRSKMTSYPTVNPKAYELACYLRWFAFSQRLLVTPGRHLMVDLDVFPVTFTAEEYVPAGPLVFLDASYNPCAVAANLAGALMIHDMLERGPVLVTENGRDHCSDMTILQERGKGLPNARICANYTPESDPSPLAHFAHVSVGSNKASAVKQFFNSWNTKR